ncbi:hypothetical protein I215_01958 [Galbibacter marinus]|uniref:Uncharacterized protein n=1 Tax=Galbibacter marinus TaxID=555500 RepID=K2P5I9_9FLAO|nr:hypothetical protein [Galbibacter marinus]EKF56248.1 hypothetical protein I215_01958 [Galbibacter marinus]
MNITHKQIVDYMKGLHDNNTSTKSFYRFNISEIQGSIRSNIDYPCIALESPEGDFSGSRSNNSLDNKLFAFSILDKPVQGDYSDEDIKLDNCERIGKKFLSRMRYDSRIQNSLVFNLFHLSDTQYHKVGPIFTDRLYGYRFEIKLSNSKIDMLIDPEDWTDLDSRCP